MKRPKDATGAGCRGNFLRWARITAADCNAVERAGQRRFRLARTRPDRLPWYTVINYGDPPLWPWEFHRESPFTGRPGTGPFFGQKTGFMRKTKAENMDLSPYRPYGRKKLGQPRVNGYHQEI